MDVSSARSALAASRKKLTTVTFVIFLLAGCITLTQCRFKTTITPTPTGATLEVTDLGDCVLELSMKVTQGGKTQKRTASANSGGAKADFGPGIDWTKPLAIEVVVKIKQSDECEALAGMTLIAFSGTPKPKNKTQYTVAFDQFTLAGETTVPGKGKVFGGQGPTKDGHGVLIWFQPDAAFNCAQTCWQQWVKTQAFWVNGGAEKEIFRNDDFKDAAGNPQKFGHFGRDIPQASTGNCFREDPIPGVPGKRGIVDVPHWDFNRANARFIYDQSSLDILQHIVGGGLAPAKRTIRFRFTARSVLWCLKPAPPEIIGSASWVTTQDWEFESSSKVKAATKIEQQPSWTAGASGLPGPMTSHQ